MCVCVCVCSWLRLLGFDRPWTIGFGALLSPAGLAHMSLQHGLGMHGLGSVSVCVCVCVGLCLAAVRSQQVRGLWLWWMPGPLLLRLHPAAVLHCLRLPLLVIPWLGVSSPRLVILLAARSLDIRCCSTCLRTMTKRPAIVVPMAVPRWELLPQTGP